MAEPADPVDREVDLEDEADELEGPDGLVSGANDSGEAYRVSC